MIWNGDPELFRIGSFAIRWYGLMFALGFFIGVKYVEIWFEKLGVANHKDQANRVFTYVILGTVIGARLAHCLFYDPSYYLQNLHEIPMVWKGGLASHGGYAGVIIALFLFAKKCPEMTFLKLTDLLTVPSLFTGSLIRVGNFFNSEIVGKISDAPWAITFKAFDPNPRHPTQVYESMSYFLISSFLFVLYKKKHKEWGEGRILGLCLMMGMGIRIPLEFTKMTQSELVQGLPINMGQILSLLFCFLGAYLFFRKPKNTLLA